MIETQHTFRIKLLALYLLSLVLIAACQPVLAPVPRPTPSVLTVQSTPALWLLRNTYRYCVENLENTGLILLDTPAASIDLNKSALALRWGASSSLKDYAVIVGQEELVIITHLQNSLNSITLPLLQAIYSGAQREWPRPGPVDDSTAVDIQPWVYLNGDDTQEIFESAILNGQLPSERVVFLAPDPAAMREAVATNPAAIGFLPRRWLDETVRAISVEGLDPQLLRQPVLAISSSAPQGLEKSWLLCLQEQISK